MAEDNVATTAQKLLDDLARNLTEVERDILKHQRREKELQAERLAVIKNIRALRKYTGESRKGDD